MCGDRFTDRGEQNALYDVLVGAEKGHAWPTKQIRMELRRAWGWDMQK